MSYIIIGIVTAIGFIVLQSACKNKSTISAENPFEGLRNLAISTTPEQLQLDLPMDETIVFGVVMDWGIDRGAIATTVAYQTGDASLYLSSGGGIIGGGQHQNVNDAAKQFVRLSQTFLINASQTQTTPLPETDSVKFYFLTNKGIYVSQEQVKNFEDHSSPWLDLFEEGNKVLTELQLTTEHRP